MPKTTTMLVLDVAERQNIKAIVAKQYDYNSRRVAIRMMNRGEIVYIEQGAIVTINATRTIDGEKNTKQFLGEVGENGTVSVPLTEWILQDEGEVECSVSVYDESESKLTTLSFIVEVEHSEVTDGNVSEDENYDLLIELLAEVSEAKSAEVDRKRAEAQRVTDEMERMSAEETRSQNEAEREEKDAQRDIAFNVWEEEFARLPAYDGRISSNTKRISNLEAAVSEKLIQFVVDDSSDTSKIVPDNAFSYAMVNEVGGATVRDAASQTLLASKVSGVKSIGANMYEGQDLFFSKSQLVELEKPIKAGVYTVSCVSTTTNAESGIASISFVGGGTGKNVNVAIPNGSRVSRVVTLTSDVSQIRFNSRDSYDASTGYDATFSNIMIHRGSAEREYEQYIAEITMFSPSILDIDGYGDGKLGGASNILDFDKGIFEQKFIRREFDGSEDWRIEYGGASNSYFVLKLAEYGSVVNFEIASNRYDTKSIESANTHTGINLLNSSAWNSACVYVRPNNPSSFTLSSWKQQLVEWKNAGNPLVVVYENVATRYIDVSSEVGRDNMIRSFDGGEIELIIDGAQPNELYSKITFQKKTNMEAI